MIVIAFVSLAVYLLGWSDKGVQIVSNLGPMPLLGVVLHLPQVPLGDWQFYLTSGLAVALLSIMEALSVSKSVALARGEKLKYLKRTGWAGHRLHRWWFISISSGIGISLPYGGQLKCRNSHTIWGCIFRILGYSGGFVITQFARVYPVAGVSSGGNHLSNADCKLESCSLNLV